MVNPMRGKFFCFSMALDEKKRVVYTGGSTSRVISFPEQTKIAELKRVKNCSPYLSPLGTYVMFFNDSSYMYLYETAQLEKCIFHGSFKMSGSNVVCWKDDECFLFATEGTINSIYIDKNNKKVEKTVLVDLREYMENPDLQITSVDCCNDKVLLFVRKWMPGINNCIVEIDKDGDIRVRNLGDELSGYDDVRYDRKGGVFYSNRSKNIAWCKKIDYIDKADKTIENVKSYCTRVSSDGRYVVAGVRDGEKSSAVIFEANTFLVKRRFEYETARWGLVGFSSDSHYVLVGGNNAQIIDVMDLNKE